MTSLFFSVKGSAAYGVEQSSAGGWLARGFPGLSNPVLGQIPLTLRCPRSAGALAGTGLPGLPDPVLRQILLTLRHPR